MKYIVYQAPTATMIMSEADEAAIVVEAAKRGINLARYSRKVLEWGFVIVTSPVRVE